jgi:hypothetical protein
MHWRLRRPEGAAQLVAEDVDQIVVGVQGRVADKLDVKACGSRGSPLTLETFAVVQT